jgi:nucleoside triphosphatase
MADHMTTSGQGQIDLPILHRTIVVGIIQNERGDTLICKKPPHRGVFPGQWGLPGGGIEAGERMEDALRREIREECGIEVRDIKPLFFTDGQVPKLYPDGSRREVYMIFLVFACRAAGNEIRLDPEFSEYAWVEPGAFKDYDLNSITIDTFQRMGWR